MGPGPELGVGNGAGVAVGEAKVQPGLGRPVELVGRDVVPHPVCSVVGEPETSYFRYNPGYATTFLPCAVYNGSM